MLVKVLPVFVDILPDTHLIKSGEIWISHKYRTVNLRCPCGCGELTVLSLHPTRWHIHFDGKSISLEGPTGGSVWAHSGCKSHYFIKNNTIIWADRIDPRHHAEYAHIERTRLIESRPSRLTFRSWFKRICRCLSPINWKK